MHAPPPHSASVAHARHRCCAAGTQTLSVVCGNVTSRHSQPSGQSLLHVREQTPPVLPTGSTQNPALQSLCLMHGSPNSPTVCGASSIGCSLASTGARDGVPQPIAKAIAITQACHLPTSATLGCFRSTLQARLRRGVSHTALHALATLMSVR